MNQYRIAKRKRKSSQNLDCRRILLIEKRDDWSYQMFKTVCYPNEQARDCKEAAMTISYPTVTDEAEKTIINEIKTIMQSVVLQQTKQAGGSMHD